MSSGRLVFTVFVVLQVADGLMTYGAVSIFGVVAEGEFLVIVGPSGCGKTTVLNILAGLDRPSAGSVTLDGREITGPGPALFGAKLLACGCGAVLHLAGARKTLGALSVLYLFGAIGPWLHELALNP